MQQVLSSLCPCRSFDFFLSSHLRAQWPPPGSCPDFGSNLSLVPGTAPFLWPLSWSLPNTTAQLIPVLLPFRPMRKWRDRRYLCHCPHPLTLANEETVGWSRRQQKVLRSHHQEKAELVYTRAVAPGHTAPGQKAGDLAASPAPAHQPESPHCGTAGEDPGLLLPGWSWVMIPRERDVEPWPDHLLSSRLDLICSQGSRAGHLFLFSRARMQILNG